MKKVILITGASSGMGKDAALRLVKEGHIVYGAARRVNKMQDIIDAGGHVVELDVTNHDQIKRAVDKVILEQGRIDVLWNNAGYSVNGAVEDVSYQDAKQQFEVNLFGLAEVTKAVLPHMRKQESGTIVNTSSTGGKIHIPIFGAWYHASKFALEGWSDALRMEVAPLGIDVVIIEPGGVDTEFSEVLHDPLIERSKGSAYEEQVLRTVRGIEAVAKHGPKLAPPSVISKVMVKIVNAKRPKTRYVAGSFANTMLWMRKLLSDRMYDKLIGKMINSMYDNALKKQKS